MNPKNTRVFIFPAKRKIIKSVWAPASARAAKEAHQICHNSGFEPRFLAEHKATIRQTHRRVNCFVAELPKIALKSFSAQLKKRGHRLAPVQPVYLLLKATKKPQAKPAAIAINAKRMAEGKIDTI